MICKFLNQITKFILLIVRNCGNPETMHSLTRNLRVLLIVSSSDDSDPYTSMVSKALVQLTTRIRQICDSKQIPKNVIVNNEKLNNSKDVIQMKSNKSIGNVFKSWTSLESMRERIVLPVEIIYQIIALVDSQNTLYSFLTVNSTWSFISLKQLYHSPRFNSTLAFKKFISTESKDTNLFKNVKHILFEPCRNGSLSGYFDGDGGEELNAFHSCLFRLFVGGRNVDGPSDLIFRMLDKFPNLLGINERNVGIDFARRDNKCEDANSIMLLKRYSPYYFVFMSRYFLAASELKEIYENYYSSPYDYETCKIGIEGLFGVSFAGLVFDDAQVFSKQSRLYIFIKGESSMRIVTRLISKLNNSILSQIQYLTYSSQKLLDCFTMSKLF